MLPRAARLTQSDTFRRTARAGARAGTGTLVLHWLAAAPNGTGVEMDPGTGTNTGSAQVGFVVSKSVGNAVSRNRVKRRLRHLTREHLGELPAGGVLVVRALPESATASHAQLQGDLTRALRRLRTRSAA